MSDSVLRPFERGIFTALPSHCRNRAYGELCYGRSTALEWLDESETQAQNLEHFWVGPVVSQAVLSRLELLIFDRRPPAERAVEWFEALLIFGEVAERTRVSRLAAVRESIMHLGLAMFDGRPSAASPPDHDVVNNAMAAIMGDRREVLR